MNKHDEEKCTYKINCHKNYDAKYNSAMHVISLEKINYNILEDLEKYDFRSFKTFNEKLKINTKYFNEILLEAKNTKEKLIENNNIIDLCKCIKIIETVNEEQRLLKEIIDSLTQVTNLEEVMVIYKDIEDLIINCIKVIKYINYNIIKNNLENIDINKIYTKEYVIKQVEKKLNKIKKHIFATTCKNDFFEFKILKAISMYFVEDLKNTIKLNIVANLNYNIMAYKNFLKKLNENIVIEVNTLRKNSNEVDYVIRCEGYEKLMFLCERYYVLLNNISEQIKTKKYMDIIDGKTIKNISNAIAFFEIFNNKVKENNLNSDLMDYLINGHLLGINTFQVYKNLGIIKNFLNNIENICLEIINSKNVDKYIFILKDWDSSLKKFIDKVNVLIKIYNENNKEIQDIYYIIYDCLSNLQGIINSKEYEKIKFYKIKLFIHQYKDYFQLERISKITYEKFKKSKFELNSIIINE